MGSVRQYLGVIVSYLGSAPALDGRWVGWRSAITSETSWYNRFPVDRMRGAFGLDLPAFFPGATRSRLLPPESLCHAHNKVR